MSSDSQGTESTEIAAVFERDEREWDYDEEDGFLVDVIAEEERSVAAESDCTDEGVPGGFDEELDEGDELKDDG